MIIIQIVLTFFDMLQGPQVHLAIPEVISPKRKEIVEKLLDLTESGFFEHHNKVNECFACANYSFSIPSEWARGKEEHLMLSVIVEEGQKITQYQKILEKFINLIRQEPELFKGLYIGQTKKDPNIKPMHQRWMDLLYQLFQECNASMDSQKPGKMMVFGLQKVGKTSIIQRITSDTFDANIRPTLGIQMIKSMIDSFKFIIFDLSGQEVNRKAWYDKPVYPNAIVFVIDCAMKSDQEIETKKEFERLISHYFGKDSNEKLDKKTPILILGNKIDLVKNFSEKNIEKILKPKNYEINYKIGCVSALKNIGINENFKWLVKELLSI